MSDTSLFDYEILIDSTESIYLLGVFKKYDEFDGWQLHAQVGGLVDTVDGVYEFLPSEVNNINQPIKIFLPFSIADKNVSRVCVEENLVLDIIE